MAKCIATLKVCQSPDERQDYAFNITDELAIHWQPSRAYETGQVVRPNELPATGFEYVATASDSSGGMSNGEAEPIWPKVEGATVTDGSITWTTQLPSYDGLRDRISTVDWYTDGDMVLSDPVEIDVPGLQEVRVWAQVSTTGGGEAGTVYNTYCLITTLLGAIYECRLQITIA